MYPGAAVDGTRPAGALASVPVGQSMDWVGDVVLVVVAGAGAVGVVTVVATGADDGVEDALAKTTIPTTTAPTNDAPAAIFLTTAVDIHALSAEGAGLSMRRVIAGRTGGAPDVHFLARVGT